MLWLQANMSFSVHCLSLCIVSLSFTQLLYYSFLQVDSKLSWLRLFALALPSIACPSVSNNAGIWVSIKHQSPELVLCTGFTTGFTILMFISQYFWASFRVCLPEQIGIGIADICALTIVTWRPCLLRGCAAGHHHQKELLEVPAGGYSARLWRPQTKGRLQHVCTGICNCHKKSN